MILTKWSPVNKVRCFNPFFANFFKDDVKEGNEDKESRESLVSWAPVTDIIDEKDNFVLKMEIPGLNKDQVKIEIENDTLSVSGERTEEKEVKEENYHWSERRSGKFYRAFRLPKNVDTKKINASMKDGILELKVPKPEEIKPKNIPITVH